MGTLLERLVAEGSVVLQPQDRMGGPAEGPLERYHRALADWRFEGAIVLKGCAAEGLRTTLEGVTEKYFKEALYRFACEENGEIDQVKEEREPWRNHWEWHYDLHPTILGVKLYVETRLYPESFSSRHDPVIQVVRIKPA